MQRFLAGHVLHRRAAADFPQIRAAAPSRLLPPPFPRAFSPSRLRLRLLQAACRQIFFGQAVQTRLGSPADVHLCAELDQSWRLDGARADAQRPGVLAGKLLAVHWELVEAGIRFGLSNWHLVASAAI